MLSKEDKTRVIKENQSHATDSGSPEIQVALLTERINLLVKHFANHKKDFGSRPGLMKLVGQRKRLLEYIKKDDVGRYEKLIQKLGLRK
ncbi:MAG: 30S ribosomal protein S15 [Acidobacteriota bacterium]